MANNPSTKNVRLSGYVVINNPKDKDEILRLKNEVRLLRQEVKELEKAKKNYCQLEDKYHLLLESKGEMIESFNELEMLGNTKVHDIFECVFPDKYSQLRELVTKEWGKR